MWSPKSVNKIFPSQRNKNQSFWSPDGKFWSPMFLLRIRTIFPLTNNIKYKHTCRSKTTTNEVNAGHIRSFERPLTVSSHFCTFSMCKHRFSMCKRITNRDLLIYEFLYVSSNRRKERRFVKGEALLLLRKNSSHLTINENMRSFKTRLKNRGVPK